MAQINLGKIRLTETELDEKLNQRLGSVKTELDEKLNQRLGNVKLGVDENGNPGYYKYDEEIGADTVIPFKKGGSEGGELPFTGGLGFNNTSLVSYSGAQTYNFSSILENVIKINDINQIKMVTKIKEWYRINSSVTTTAIKRQVRIFIVCKNENGVYKEYYSNWLFSSSAYTALAINEELTVTKSQLLSFLGTGDWEVISIGNSFYIYGGSSNYFFTSGIRGTIEESCMKFEIT